LEGAQAQHLTNTDPRLANSWQQLGGTLIAENKITEGLQCLEQARAIYAQGGSAGLLPKK
jgi:hypothetical protein